MNVLALLVTATAFAAPPPADLVLRGGKVVTLDEQRPEASAVAARRGRIVAVGTDDEVEVYVDEDTRVVELEGRLAIPGFIEGHGHLIGLGRSLQTLDLTTAKSWDDIVRLVGRAAATTEPGTWIEGRGWHQSKWSSPPEPNVEGYPTHHDLSAVTPHHPVRLVHASGHMAFANAAAMSAAGIDRDTDDPPGGTILRDGEGRPTGALRETAQALLYRAAGQETTGQSPESRRAQLVEQIRLAVDACRRNGITSFQDAGSSFEVVDALRDMAEQGALDVRMWVMLRESNRRLAERMADYRLIGVGDHYLTVRAIKRSIDGALGAHGAWLLEPYADLTDSSGLNTTSIESIEQTGRLALEHDFQLCVHAIGDRANRETLDLFERLFGGRRSPANLRWRIEHAQHLHPDDIPRFAELGVIASMQGIHCTSDAPYVIARLGERRAKSGAYVWRSLLDAGAVVTNGTDVPVERIDPIPSFYASITRDVPGAGPFFPEQRMTRKEALRSYTLAGAYAAHEEELKGSLKVGKLADVVVLSHDILTVPAKDVPSARVVYTIVGGRVVYDARAPE